MESFIALLIIFELIAIIGATGICILMMILDKENVTITEAINHILGRKN